MTFSQKIVYLKALGLMTINEKYTVNDFYLKINEYISSSDIEIQDQKEQLLDTISFIFNNVTLNKNKIIDQIILLLINKFPTIT